MQPSRGSSLRSSGTWMPTDIPLVATRIRFGPTIISSMVTFWGVPPIPGRASKETVYRSLDTAGGIAAAYQAQREYPAVVALTRSEDRVEGPKAFAEKRKPRWQGR